MRVAWTDEADFSHANIGSCFIIVHSPSSYRRGFLIRINRSTDADDWVEQEIDGKSVDYSLSTVKRLAIEWARELGCKVMSFHWDGGRAIKDLDIPSWVKRFNVEYVSEQLLGDKGAIHHLTTLGRELDLGEWDILIAEDFKPYERYVLVHEAVENWLRRRGWKYEPSHQYALRVEEELFDDEPAFAKYRQK